MKVKTILFDLDGTLLDTNELIISSFLYTLHKFLPDRSFSREDIIPLMGGTLSDVLNMFDQEKCSEMEDVYRAYNRSNHDEMVVIFPQVKEVIEQLYQSGIRMGIVTTKRRDTVEMGLRLFQLEPYFDSVITLQEVENPKPHPEPILKAMKALEANPETTLMIGDSSFDIEAAKRAGIDSVGVAWSLKGAEHLRTFSPTYIINEMKDLLTIVMAEGNREDS